MNALAYLAFFPKISNRRFQKLAAYFSNYALIGTAEFSDLARAGWEENIAHEYVSWRENNPPEKFLRIMEREGIYTVSLDEPGYPPLLKEITDPPMALFVRGELPTPGQPALGIVGTRKMTQYGKLACETIVRPLAEQGLVIVSGLALGVDAVAHEITLSAGGTTVAVLGGGIDRATVGPHCHGALAERIASNGGAVISEYPPAFQPNKTTFPARNRIIAGLTLGTIVVEAPINSGALITARCALDYNREVMVVPHPITSENGAGGNYLLKQGARMVTEANDALEALNLAAIFEKAAITAPNLNSDEETIYQLLSHEPKHIDQIIEKSAMTSAAVGSSLSLMEMKGIVKNLGQMRYIKV
jgi:DNA processing protein